MSVERNIILTRAILGDPPTPLAESLALDGTKVYLAGPMTGYPEHNYPQFKMAAARLREAGIAVVSPAELHDGDTTRPREYYIRRDLLALLESDIEAVVVLPGWQESSGAQLELEVAFEVGIPRYSIAKIFDGQPS